MIPDPSVCRALAGGARFALMRPGRTLLAGVAVFAYGVAQFLAMWCTAAFCDADNSYLALIAGTASCCQLAAWLAIQATAPHPGARPSDVRFAVWLGVPLMFAPAAVMYGPIPLYISYMLVPAMMGALVGAAFGLLGAGCWADGVGERLALWRRMVFSIMGGIGLSLVVPILIFCMRNTYPRAPLLPDRTFPMIATGGWCLLVGGLLAGTTNWINRRLPGQTGAAFALPVLALRDEPVTRPDWRTQLRRHEPPRRPDWRTQLRRHVR